MTLKELVLNEQKWEDGKSPLEKLPQSGVGFQGFMCPKSHREVALNFCWTKCMAHCMPLPVLSALSKQIRPPDEDPFTFHVTELYNPPQQIWLQRHKPWYVYPESLMDMNIGTSWHDKIDEQRGFVQELGLEKDYIMEKNCTTDLIINVVSGAYLVTISGTPDLYVCSTKTLWDYKVVKYYYTLKYMLEGKWEDNAYIWQLNTYRVLFYPEAEEMGLFCYIKDWKYNFPERYGVNHTEVVKPPKISDAQVHARIKECLKEHVKAEVTGEYRECKEEEMWNNRLRCKYYCSVSRVCPQYKEYLKNDKYIVKPKINKKIMHKVR